MIQEKNSGQDLINRRFARAFVLDYGLLDDGKIWVALPDSHIFQIDKLTLSIILDLNAGKTVKESSDKFGIEIGQIEFLLKKIASHSGITTENNGKVTRFSLRQDMDIALYILIFFGMLVFQAYYFLFIARTVLMKTLPEGVVVAILALVAVIAHEAGHFISAWKFTGIKPRAGFEMNFIFPSIYVDTHEAWRLPRNKRFVINTAGMFFDLIVNTACVLIVLVYRPAEYYATPFLITQYMRWAILLNPIFKGDGYWILADTLGLVNMEKRGIAEMKSLKFNLLSVFGVISVIFSVLSFFGLIWFFISLAGGAVRAVIGKLVFR